MKKTIFLRKINRLVAFFVIVFLAAGFFATQSHAANLTNANDTLSRLKASVDADHNITFTTPSGVAAGETIEITFPSGFSTTLVDYTDVDVKVDGVDLSLGAIPNNAVWGAAFGGVENRTLTLASGTGSIIAGSVVAIKIGANATFNVAGDAQINNPVTKDIYVINIAGSFGDTASIPVIIIDDDQVLVSGDIYATLEFSISSNTVGFGNFSNTNVRYATNDGTGSFVEPGNDLPVKIVAGTNGSNGLTISVLDQGDGVNSGLYSASASELIPAAPSLSVVNDSKTFSIYGKNALNLTINEGFDNDGVADLSLARATQTFASSPTQTNGSIDISLIAATDSATKAGNYLDTLTLTCTGNY